MLDKNALITYCNDYLLRITGWQREEVMGKSWFDIFVPIDDRSLMKPLFADLLANLPGAAHHDNEIVTRSGSHLMIRWNNSLLRASTGEVIGTTSIGEDITERQQAEEVLAKRANELERFHRLSVGREMQMIELKKEVNALAVQAGQEPPYKASFSA